jgi:hypothetical protein
VNKILPAKTRQRPEPLGLKSRHVGVPDGKGPVQARKNCADLPNNSEQRITEHRIRASLAVIAELLQHSDAYLPIFLRLEAELAAAEARRAAIDRAKTFLDPSR